MKCCMLQKQLLLSVISFTGLQSVFSQETATANNAAKPNNDSLWYFHPFSIDLLAGVWIPAGKLSEFYHPSAQFGGSLGLMITRKMRLQFWIMPRLLQPVKPIGVLVNDSIIYNNRKNSGASLGGWVSHTVYQNRQISAELISGITWEDIGTNVENPNRRKKYDSLLSISSVGLSIGVHSWIHTFKQLNFGLRAVYNYSTYDRSKNLAHPIGGSSITISLVHRFPKRRPSYKEYYTYK